MEEATVEPTPSHPYQSVLCIGWLHAANSALLTIREALGEGESQKWEGRETPFRAWDAFREDGVATAGQGKANLSITLKF